MSYALLTGLIWLVALLALFLAAQRWLHRQIHAIFLILTRRAELAMGLFALVFFPGVFLHELSHFLMARLLQVRTGRFSLLPKMMNDGTLRLGFVETARSDVLRDALIGTAPLLSGGAVVTLIGIYLLPVVPLFEAVTRGGWQTLWDGLAALPRMPDFWLWFYLVFEVSSTMLPSPSDRRAWLPLILVVVVLAALALLAGAGPWLLANLAPGLTVLVQTLAAMFAISLAVHLLLGLPIGLVAALVSRLTGLRVVG